MKIHLLIVLAATAAWPAAAQEPEARELSRAMRLGIQFFERRDDAQAMDRFMEVLTKGDPSERPLANEYINLITHRMNTGERVVPPPKASAPKAEPAALASAVQPAPPVPAARPAPPPPVAAAPAAPAAPDVIVEPAEAPVTASRPAVPTPVVAPTAAASPAAEVPRAPAPAPGASPTASRPTKAVMVKEIKAKIKVLKENSLAVLKKKEGIRVLSLENGDPQAIGIPSDVLFQSGVSFQRSAGPLLDALTSLVYGLSGAQVVVLPEGTAAGDAKVPDMRRTMGISAHLIGADIAPSRVRVNLLNTQVDIPRPLQDFRGVILLFIYNQPLNLAAENALAEEAGPPLSLGAFPKAFKAENGEGAIIEFSVQDPPSGLTSWEFKLLAPSADGTELAPLQEVVGGGPVYHQIYWNGRQNYFGALYPAGRYECVLTATDGKGRRRTLHRWIQVQGEEPKAPRPEQPAAALGLNSSAAAAAAAPNAAAPSADLPGSKPAEKLLKERPAKRAKARRFKRRPKKAAAPAVESEEQAPALEAAEAAPAKEGEPAGKPSATPYEVPFGKDQAEPLAEADKVLAQIAETVEYYPLENLDVVGYAHSSETQSAALAQRRAQAVAAGLMNRYKVDPKKIQVHSAISEEPRPRVEVRFVSGD